MRNIIKENPIVAIMRNIPLSITTEYIESIARGGINCFEIALNSQDAVNQIKQARQISNKDLLIGAGTVLSVEDVKKSLDAGAQFLLSPSINTEVLEYCAINKVKLLPGVMTPTDVSNCIRYGFDVLKLFPASDLPLNYINSLKGPFDKTDYVAVGGVNTKNFTEFLNRGFLGVGIGSNLVSKEHLHNRQWAQITLEIKESIHLLRKDEVYENYKN
ncbi:bifunctional 4-hydroxy-2-oxoglutarate aldolase/2-dehydro-3-deoxy-phosphogluconate aldolase [Anaerocolumna sedimenticola]|uniref:Bifunctional 4-hydroxy-2-oxoglutarate aldolase/2-dehydro-3-deoxy-phosphogluconate aldolase n=1 Tax=Anaerocolumna sedimenticola TaxID=2696063 RepID=A0A6P1TNR5_9FIRM|nr:bifunctional 4-hydroxy-2-oxoglutarate aldolase/2-dehydro-3-deoxy-phosphogluconate aldolase [Anaerocolumna sedimenticola]QHQ61977.1 bifunctional 4-hydroxy-2-oxoglutarate aldolase/2-dehydro-3-deoxy-phosphogluconate aldolase [Anaerocolumna sedimenticola]